MTTQSQVKFGLFMSTIEVQSDGSPNDWPSILAKTQIAEQIGLDTVWIMDRLLFAVGDRNYGVWDPLALLPALAMATDRIQLGTWVLSAAYRHPALLARNLAAVQAISGGRLIVGIGPGNADNDPECERYGLPMDHRYQRFTEAFAILRGMFRDGTSSFGGNYWQTDEATLLAPGPSERPPLYVAARGDHMLRQAARHADGWAGMAYTGPDAFETFRNEMQRVDDACRRTGRDPESLGRAYLVFVEVSGDNADETAAPWITCSGSPSEVAVCLRRFIEGGVTHLLVSPIPDTPASVEQLAPVIRELRDSISSA
ncbi:MAG: LLM class flavin-dependent oxidoreductase [Thermomicrobiales bacterium]